MHRMWEKPSEQVMQKKIKWVQEVIYSIKYNKNVTSISFYNF